MNEYKIVHLLEQVSTDLVRSATEIFQKGTSQARFDASSGIVVSRRPKLRFQQRS